MGLHPPRTFPWSNLFPVPPRMHQRVFGWFLCPFIVWRPTKAMTYFISIIFCCSVWWPKRRANVAPHTFRPSHVSSEIPSPPPTLSSGWLLCQIIDGGHLRPVPPYLSIFDVRCFIAPNKGTSRCDREPSAGHLLQTYREQRCDDLGPPLLYPWRESKAAG